MEAGSLGHRKAVGALGMAASVPPSGEEEALPRPRGPTSYYYMLPMKVRVQGLKVALTVKLAQDDLHIVDSLELPTSDPST